MKLIRRYSHCIRRISLRRLALPLLLVVGVATSARAEVYELPPAGDDVIGAATSIRARAEDTLLDIARRHGLGYEDIVRANPEVDPWLPGEGTAVVLPTRFVLPRVPRRGIVLNLAEYRLYYFPPAEPGKPALVMTYPISIGRMDWSTPIGKTRIVSKVVNPSWYPPASVRKEHAEDGHPLPNVVPPGPDNPLGHFKMRLSLPGYLIHGTNRPAGVGMRVTHGCIRMFPEDIEFLFKQVRVDTPVRIINEPLKLGWDNDRLVLEAHRTLDVAPLPAAADAPGVTIDAAVDADAVDPAIVEPDLAKPDSAAAKDVEPPLESRLTALTIQFVAATNSHRGQLDWDLAERILKRADGIPEVVGHSIKNAATRAASE